MGEGEITKCAEQIARSVKLNNVYKDERDAHRCELVDALMAFARAIIAARPGDPGMSDAEALAMRFHEAYERLAPQFGYETREASARPWADVPANNKALMPSVPNCSTPPHTWR